MGESWRSVCAVERADLDNGLLYSCGGAFFLVGSYYYVQPLCDVIALSLGLKNLPLVSVVNVLVVGLVNWVYAAMVHAVPIRQVMPTLNRTVQCGLCLIGALYELCRRGVLPHERPVSLCLYFFVSVYGLFIMTTFWARMASVHTSEEAKRVYGMLGAAAQIGQMLASASGPFLNEALGGSIVLVLVSSVLMEAATQLVSLRATRGRKEVEEHTSRDHGSEVATSGVSTPKCHGLKLLISTHFMRQVTLNTLLTTYLTLGIWYEKAAIITDAIPDNDNESGVEQARYQLFASINLFVSVCTVIIQLVVFPHALRGIGVTGALLVLPSSLLASFIPLLIRPSVYTIALVDAARRVIHYALNKPTKEGLYAAMSPEVQFVAKPLLDTFVYRGGYLLCSGVFAVELQWQVAPGVRRALLVAVSLALCGNSYVLGQLAEREGADRSQGRLL